MPGKTYSAGTIFLQVVPVFGDTMDAIKRQAKDANQALGDEMEKGAADAGKRANKVLATETTKDLDKVGKEAGEKYSGAFAASFKNGVAKASRELEPIKLELEDKNVQDAFDKIQRRFKALKKVKIGVDVDGSEAATELARLELQLRLLKDQAKHVEVRADLDAAHKAVKGFVQSIQKSNPEFKIDADFSEAERELGDFQRKFQQTVKGAAKRLGSDLNPAIRRVRDELNSLSDVEIGVDVTDEEAKAALRGLMAQLEHLDGTDITTSAHANVGSALKDLAVLDGMVRKLDGEEINIQADADTGAAVAQLGLLAAIMSKVRRENRNTANDAMASANSFRAFSFVILGLALAIPAVIPLIAALGGALLALGPILAGVGAGFGTMILGFSGIGDAVKALSDVQKNAAKDSEASAKAMRNASRSVADAERNLARARQDTAQRSADAARAVADAERSSADAIERALEQRRRAEESLARAQRDATQAQKELREARRLAQQDIEDLNDTVAQNALDERQAVIDLFNAQVNNTATQQDGAATNLDKEQASIDLAEAQLRLKNIRDEQKELARDKSKADKQGVNGTRRVQSAQDALASALDRQKDAQRALGEASEAVTEARIDGARRVADAVRAQQRSEADGARMLSDAQRNLIRAQEDYQTALTDTAVVGSASAQALEDAMGKLSPAGQAFARYLFSIREQFWAIRAAAQEGMLPGVQNAFETILGKYGPGLTAFVGAMGAAIGGLFQQFGQAMASPLWEDFFGMMSKLGPTFMTQFGTAFINWMSFFARLLTIVAPWSEKFSEAMLGISEAALKWVSSKKGTKVITDFMGYLERVGPKVWSFLKDLVKAFVALAEALAPVGEVILAALDGLFKFIDSLSPRTLGAIITLIVTLTVAFQVMNGIIALSLAGSAIAATVAAGGITAAFVVIGGAIILIAGLFVLLYTQSETFRDIFHAVAKAVGAAAKWLWEKGIKPWFTFTLNLWKSVLKGMEWAWDNILWPVFKAIGSVIKWLWQKVVSPVLGLIWGYWKFVFKAMKFLWVQILSPVLSLIGHIVWNLWKLTFKVALGSIIELWKLMAKGISYAWKHWIEPAMVAMGAMLDWVQGKFKDGVRRIGELWDSLREKLAKPVRTVIELVNKYLVGGFNKVAKFVGSKPMPDIPVPGFAQKSSGPTSFHMAGGPGRTAMATGGVLPGYTPGRDVHRFVSPTGGMLDLSGGEAVMRPEFTRALGPKAIHALNRLARSGGVQALRRALGGQAFASGGVFWPVPGRKTSTYAGHDGVDINRGSGWDDFRDPIRAAAPGRVSYVGYGRGYGQAVMITTPSGMTNIYGHTDQAYVRAGQQVSAGQLIGLVGNTGNSSAPHLHFGVSPGLSYESALAFLGGKTGGKGFWGTVTGWVKNALSEPAEWFKERVGGAFNKLADSSPFGGMLAGLGKKMMDAIVDRIKGGTGEDVNAPRAVAGYTGIVKQALSMLGQPLSLVGKVLHRMNQESGGNPNAINNWDINAKNGTPSVGLMQVIGPTFKAYAGKFRNVGPFMNGVSTNPLANIFAGLNYALNRYGSIAKPMMQPGGYADGGIIGETSAGSVPDNGTMMYDNGGYLPPGLTTVLNLTGKPEPVFTADQFAGLGRGNAAGVHYEPHFEGSDLTAGDVADDLMFAFRRLEKRGKYAGSGV